MGNACLDLKKIGINQIIAYGETKLRSLTFIRRIKRSKISTVWLAKNEKSKSFYAVKITKKVEARRKNCIHLSINEQSIVQELNHPLIVNTIETFQDLSNLYIVLEYMPYGSLRDYLNYSGSLTQSQARFVIICLLISVQYLHKLQIAHLDLKPENLLIDEVGYFRLCDFNLSNDFKKIDKKNRLSGIGTYGYQAPQINETPNLIGLQSDLYSIGVICAEMLIGIRRRNSQIHSSSYLKQILKERVGVSTNCFNFISSLIEQVPSSRLGSGNFQDIWSHPWLQICEVQRLQYMLKSVPSFVHDQYRKSITEYLKQNNIGSSDQQNQDQDTLLSKAMLEDKGFQKLFCNFKTMLQRQRQRISTF